MEAHRAQKGLQSHTLVSKIGSGCAVGRAGVLVQHRPVSEVVFGSFASGLLLSCTPELWWNSRAIHCHDFTDFQSESLVPPGAEQFLFSVFTCLHITVTHQGLSLSASQSLLLRRVIDVLSPNLSSLQSPV